MAGEIVVPPSHAGPIVVAIIALGLTGTLTVLTATARWWLRRQRPNEDRSDLR